LRQVSLLEFMGSKPRRGHCVDRMVEVAPGIGYRFYYALRGGEEVLVVALYKCDDRGEVLLRVLFHYNSSLRERGVRG